MFFGNFKMIIFNHQNAFFNFRLYFMLEMLIGPDIEFTLQAFNIYSPNRSKTDHNHFIELIVLRKDLFFFGKYSGMKFFNILLVVRNIPASDIKAVV